MIGRLVLCGALLAAGAAAGQEPEKPATAEEIAAATAIADQIIEAADAQGIFVNTTDSGQAEVTHAASGMTCLFDGDPADRISIFATVDGRIPRGLDVGCVSWDEALGIDLSLFATRYQPLPTEAAVLADVQRAIERRWPGAKPYEGELATLSLEGQNPTLVAAYQVRLQDEDKLTMALVSHRDAWSFKARATGPLADAMGVSLYTGVLFEGALMERGSGDR